MTQVEELEGLENKVENQDLISTGYEKLKKTQERHYSKDEEEFQVNGIDQIYNKIIEKNFPKLRKESQRTPNRTDQKIKSPQYITVRTLSVYIKESILKATREKQNKTKQEVTYKGNPSE